MEWARDRFHFSPAVRHGDLVFVAAVQAATEQGEEGRAGHEAAFDRAFREVGAVLEASGSSWDDVLEMTTYHTDLRGQVEAFMAVKDRYVREPYPAWTAVDIDRLFSDNALAEIKVVARVRPTAN
jgi:enamine deaminase RidA (YjgF/YER057c/UK114 family)